MPIPSPADFRNKTKKHSEVREMMAQMAENVAARDDIVQLEIATSTLQIVPATLKVGRFVNNNGVEIEAAGFAYAEFELLHTRDMNVTTYVSGDAAYIRPIVFKKADNTFSTWGNLEIHYNQHDVQVPPNAVTAYVNLRMNPSVTQLTNVIIWQSQPDPNLGKKVEMHSAEIDIQAVKVEALESFLDIAKLAISSPVQQSATITAGYFVPANNWFIAHESYSHIQKNIPADIKRINFSTGITSQTVIPISFRNSSGAVIGTYGVGQQYIDQIVDVPAGATEVIMNLRNDSIENPQISFYLPNPNLSLDLTELRELVGNLPVSEKSAWNGKKWAVLGDSITEYGYWITSVASKHGLTASNFGVSGSRISGTHSEVNAMCQDARINAIPSDVDLITLMGGTNDWAQSIPLGAIDSTDPTTFNGALNTFAQKAFARWPTKRIAVATTPVGAFPTWQSRDGWTSPQHNALGLTSNDYAEAIRQFCKRSNLACIDVAKNAGWGRHNIQTALGGSTTDHLHPWSTSNATRGISNVYIYAFSQIAPI